MPLIFSEAFRESSFDFVLIGKGIFDIRPVEHPRFDEEPIAEVDAL